MIIKHYSEDIDLSELSGDELTTLHNTVVENVIYYTTRDIESEYDHNMEVLDQLLEYLVYLR